MTVGDAQSWTNLMFGVVSSRVHPGVIYIIKVCTCTIKYAITCENMVWSAYAITCENMVWSAIKSRFRSAYCMDTALRYI